jgi:hypothetical protein
MKIVKNILIGLLALQFIGIGVMKVIMPLSATIGGAGVAMVLLTILLILDKPFGLIDKARKTTYFND